MWALVLLQGYLACIVVVLIGGFVINFIEGDTWEDMKVRWGHKQIAAKSRAMGDTALDECIWFVFSTLHGMTFGEFMPVSATGHVIIMFVSSLGFWFGILMTSVILLSQLPGQKSKHLPHVVADVANACWPSYLIYCVLALAVGSQLGPYVSPDPAGFNDKYTGMYFMWCVAHRTVFGDIWPKMAEARYACFPFILLSYVYPCYAMALVAVRRPSTAQHQQLLAYMSQHPEECMGPGYMAPAEAASSSSSRGNARELQMNQMAA